MSLPTINDLLSARLTTSASGKEGDHRRLVWEREFWRQQRNIERESFQGPQYAKPEQVIVTPDRDSSSHIQTSEAELNGSSMFETSVSAPYSETRQVPDISPILLLNAKQQNVMADLKNMRPVSEYSNNAPSKSPPRQPLPYGKQQQSLIQQQNGELSIWSSDEILKTDKQLLHRLKKAITFFGLGLKRLTVSGEEIELSESTLSATKNHVKEI